MRLVLGALLATLALPALAAGAGGKLYFEDSVPSGGSSSVSMTTHRAAAFSVLLRVPTTGRAKLYLLGKKAPRGEPLVDTKTYRCEGAAGSWYCRGAYEALPKGRYTWKITWAGKPRAPAHVELTVTW